MLYLSIIFVDIDDYDTDESAPVSFICNRFYMFPTNLYNFTRPLWANRVGSQDSMRTGYQPAYRVERQQEVRYQAAKYLKISESPS